MAWDDDLLPEQRLAAMHHGSSGRVLAGPGTGKTRVLTRRILYLTEIIGIPPSQILVLTFTRFAAFELRSRVASALNSQELPRISTLHSFALRQLIRNSERIDTLPRPFRVADDWEERNIIFEDIKKILQLNRIDDVKELFNQLSSDYESNREVNIAITPNPRFVGAWSEHRSIYGYTLRSELVYQLKRALEQIDDFQLDCDFRHLLVDEYQDLNPCDLVIIRELSRRGAELYIAGDDDQSIYGFRNAFPEGIRQFPIEYPDCVDLPLNICKRCDSDILQLGEFVAELDPRRLHKNTVPEPDRPAGTVKILRFSNQICEADGVATICKKLTEPPNNINYGDILILLRVDTYGAFSNEIVRAFTDQGLPIAHGNDELNPFTSSLGREFISILRLSRNINDHLAWRTILQVKRTGVGERTIEQIYNYARNSGKEFSNALLAISNDPNIIPLYGNRVKNNYDLIISQIHHINELANQNNSGQNMTPQISHILDLIYIENDETKLSIFEEILRRINEYSLESIQDVIDSITGSISNIEPNLDSNKINILTMHKAKGLTKKIVFIMAAEDEHIPGRQEAEPGLGDERRLLFVSLTRAEKQLYITYCNQRYGQQRMLGRSTGHINRTLTRFLRNAPVHPERGQEYIDNL
jgi:DNA helicase-2/ATP-dependent DNA helicase PcrA